MKKIALLFISLLVLNNVSKAQSVTLSTTTANPTKGTVVYNNGSNQLQYWNGTGWVNLTNTAGTGWALNGLDIYKTNTGYVGIGTSSPVMPLTVKFDGQGIVQESLDGNVRVGFYATEGSAFVQTYSDHDLNFSTHNGPTQLFIQKNTGNIGIGTSSPTNRLQIGNLGSSNFQSNAFAIGNGTKATAFSQSDNAFTITSTSNMVLSPGFNTGVAGRVGINTPTPRGPLDVTGSSEAAAPFAYFVMNPGNGQPLLGNISSGNGDISIYSQTGVLASQFIAVSDARIKNIVGISNSAKDLATIKALQITDYTMQDQLQFGSRPFKKVIAQQIEEVYPQAVTRVTDIVPDIYTLTEKAVFDEANKTLTCTLAKSYQIKAGEKLQFIHPTAGKIKAEVIEVSGNTFTVKDWQHATDKIFVYGHEVNDFRSVDYEAISMLGISAIQQLAKENEEVKAQNKELKMQLEQLKSDFSARLEAIEAQLPKPTGK